MNEENTSAARYPGRIAQTGIYLGKFIRMFVYQNDWKVIPLGAIIAALTVFVTGANLYATQEGTLTGTFALTCVCIWNGMFNSIQVVCRERDIVKREHRAGMHVTSYVAAHMLYQLLLCILQTIVTLIICILASVQFPAEGIVTPYGILDAGITILLITFAADLMALMVSCIVRTTTTAMTVVPFLLIFQLIFSGGFFDLEGIAEKIKVITISHWGMDSLCMIGRYNSLPMVTLWNTLVQFSGFEVLGEKPLLLILQKVEEYGYRDDFLNWSGSFNTNSAYDAVASNLLTNWGALALLMLIFAAASVIALKFIDRDKR